MSESRKPSSQPPGEGLFGWLGRQVGHITRAIKTDVAKPTAKTIYRDTKVEEAPHPRDPNVKLRRTVIDEVVVQPPAPQIPQSTENSQNGSFD